MNSVLLSYIEKARQTIAKRYGIASISDRHLSEAIGLNPAAVNQWRKRNTFPTDETMIALAHFAGINPAKALLELNAMRTKGEVSQFYSMLSYSLRNQTVITTSEDDIGLPMDKSGKILIKRLKVTAIAAAIAVSAFSTNAIAAPAPVTSPAPLFILWEILRQFIKRFQIPSKRCNSTWANHYVHLYHGSPAPA